MDNTRTVNFVIERKLPEDFTLDRLAKYLKVLNDLIGPNGKVRLRRIARGSVKFQLQATSDYFPIMVARVASAQRKESPAGIRKPRDELQCMVEEDAVDAKLTGPTGSSLLYLRGYRARTEMAIAPIRQEHSIRGRVIGLEGKDDTKHVRLAVYASEDEARAEVKDSALAMQLKEWLFAPAVIELRGTATFRRTADGEWETTLFRADSAQPLSDESVGTVMSLLKGSLDRADVSREELFDASKLRS